MKEFRNKMISIDDNVALEKENSQINNIVTLTAKTVVFESAIMKVKEYLPSVDVLKSVYANEPESLQKKIDTLNMLTGTIANQVATTQKFRQDVQDVFLEVSNAVGTVHDLWQTMTSKPAFSNESLDLSIQSGQVANVLEKVQKLDALVKVVRDSNEMDLAMLQEGIKDLHRCGSQSVQALMDNLEKAQQELALVLAKRHTLTSEFNALENLHMFEKGMEDNKVSIYSQQVTYLRNLAKTLGVEYARQMAAQDQKERDTKQRQATQRTNFDTMTANRVATDLQKKEREFNERKAAGQGKLDQWLEECDQEFTAQESAYQKEYDQIEAKIKSIQAAKDAANITAGNEMEALYGAQKSLGLARLAQIAADREQAIAKIATRDGD